MTDCDNPIKEDSQQNLESKIEGIIITEIAAKKALEIAASEGLSGDYGLRVGIRGGGCSGYQYSMDFDQKRRDTDKVYEFYGLKLFIDPMSYQYLKGLEIDYVEGLYGSGFKFNNPKAKALCGCGSSFTVE